LNGQTKYGYKVIMLRKIVSTHGDVGFETKLL